MKDRTLAAIITIVVVILFGCPGITALCWGLASLVDYLAGSRVLTSDPGTYAWFIFGGFCTGFFLIIIAIVVSFLVLRRKKETSSPSSNEPIPPTT